MISGSICQILTNPIWVIRVRMQSAIMHTSDEFDMAHYNNIWRSFRTIYHNEGLIGLYKGSLASQIGSVVIDEGVLHVAINMPLYDYIIRQFKGGDHGKPTMMHTLIAANISKGKIALAQRWLAS